MPLSQEALLCGDVIVDGIRLSHAALRRGKHWHTAQVGSQPILHLGVLTTREAAR